MQNLTEELLSSSGRDIVSLRHLATDKAQARESRTWNKIKRICLFQKYEDNHKLCCDCMTFSHPVNE